MALAGMMSANKDALVCDLAETYGIFDYRALPVPLLATLAVGLRDDARIKMHMSGMSVPQNTLLLAAALDKLSLLVWSKTKDAQSGTNRPKPILGALLGQKRERGVTAFDTAEEFENARAAILEVK